MQHRPWRGSPYQTTTLIAVALLLLILFASAGYVLMLPDSGGNAARSASSASLESNLALWQSRRPNAFEYVVERSCFCAPDYTRPYRVRERAGQRDTTYASPLSTRDVVDTGPPPEPVGIDELFALLAEAIPQADEVSAVYDPAFGFPTRITIDWSYAMADEEQRFSIRDFEVIEYRP